MLTYSSSLLLILIRRFNIENKVRSVSLTKSWLTAADGEITLGKNQYKDGQQTQRKFRGIW